MIGFAKKIGMTRLFIDGINTPVTSVKVADSYVLQQKNIDKDGYQAVQLASYKKKSLNKAAQGHVKKNGGLTLSFGVVSEFKDIDLEEGKGKFSVKDFSEGDILSVSGKTKGLGFTGVVKRYGFRGQPASHGHDHERAVGSIGDGGAQRVFPGTKMAGRKGSDQKTLNDVAIVAVDYDKNLLFLRGSLPGPNSAVLKLRKVNK